MIYISDMNDITKRQMLLRTMHGFRSMSEVNRKEKEIIIIPSATLYLI